MTWSIFHLVMKLAAHYFLRIITKARYAISDKIIKSASQVSPLDLMGQKWHQLNSTANTFAHLYFIGILFRHISDNRGCINWQQCKLHSFIWNLCDSDGCSNKSHIAFFIFSMRATCEWETFMFPLSKMARLSSFIMSMAS